MFIAALFATAKSGKKPRCPLRSEWINRLYYIHMIKYYSAIKSNELLIHTATWMNLRIIVLSKTSLTKRTSMHDFINIKVWNCKLTHSAGMQIRDCLGLGEWGRAGRGSV